MVRAAVELVIGAIGLAAAGCGRIGFDAPASVAAIADAGRDASAARIAYVGPFVERSPGTGPSETFTGQAHAAGNAVVMQVSCAASNVPTGVSVAATGWSFMQLAPITASASSDERSATFAAIAPDAQAVSITVRWTGAACNGSKNDVGDEFTLTGGSGRIVFDAAGATQGVGNCTGSVTTAHAAATVWAACDSQQEVTAIGPGFHKGADDQVGDWAEYLITGDPAGTVEAVQFTNGVPYVLSMVTLAVE